MTCLLFILLLSGCGVVYPFWAKPYALNMDEGPEGPPEYRQGYRDGCQSGFKAYSSQYNKVWWKFKQDPALRQNPVYYRIWKDAYAYCAAYANSADGQGVANQGKLGILPGAGFK